MSTISLMPFACLLSLSLAANLRANHTCPQSCGAINCPPQFQHNCDADLLCTWCACTGADCMHLQELSYCVVKKDAALYPTALYTCDNMTATRSTSDQIVAGCSSDTECNLPCPFAPPPGSITNKCVDGVCKCVQQNGTQKNKSQCGNLPSYYMTCASVPSRAWPDMCCDGRYAESLPSMCTNPLTAPLGVCHNISNSSVQELTPTNTLDMPTKCNPDGCEGLAPPSDAKDGDECINSTGSPFEGCIVQQGKCCNDRQPVPSLLLANPTTCKNGGTCGVSNKTCRCSGCSCCDDECNIEICDGSCGPCC
jgi:hypothetical protein